MARIRSIKPEIRTSEKVNTWPIAVRYFWVLLWGYADDYGCGKDNPLLIVADAFPLDQDVTADTVAEWMDILADSGVILRYQVDGGRYFVIANWAEHQRVSHPAKSSIPPPPETLRNPSGGPLEAVATESGDAPPRGGGEQGVKQGGEALDSAEPPSPFCDRHQPAGSRGKPCGPCADARMARDIWLKKRPRTLTPVPPSREQARAIMCTEPGHDEYPMPCDLCARLATTQQEEPHDVAV